MNHEDAINELRDRLGRAEDRLSHGDSQFSEVLGAVASVKAHLQRQDITYAAMSEKIDLQTENTAAVVEMWDGGVKAVKFFCRAAAAWTFLLKKVFIPVVLPLAGVWVFTLIISHRALPEWLADAFKFFMSVL